jgi:hypothetical protein
VRGGRVLRNYRLQGWRFFVALERVLAVIGHWDVGLDALKDLVGVLYEKRARCILLSAPNWHLKWYVGSS